VGASSAPAAPAAAAAGVLVAQSAPPAASPPGGPAAAPGEARSPETIAAPPRDYLAEARASFTPENRAYQRIRVGLSLVGPLLGVLAGLLLLFTGLSQRFRDLASAGGRGRWARVLIYFSLYSLAMVVLMAPLTWYEGYALEKRFGFMNQSLGAWSLDQVKALVFQIVAVGVVPLLALAWLAIERSRRWWLWLSIGALPVTLALVLLQPLVFDPLFNDFTPLRDASLRNEILALGARAHVPARNVYEVDMSRRTTKVNAYVSGFGASQRIVLWDTALRALKRDEILFVMGHEMGHYVLQHIWKGVLLASLGAFVAFWLTQRLVLAFLRRFGAMWRVTEAGDLAAMPLVIAMLSLAGWFGAPATNLLSRAFEHESDVYALEITRDNDAGARSFLALARGNRSDPEPPKWVEWMLYTHPPLGDRIRFALAYRPWERGEPDRLYRGE